MWQGRIISISKGHGRHHAWHSSLGWRFGDDDIAECLGERLHQEEGAKGELTCMV